MADTKKSTTTPTPTTPTTPTMEVLIDNKLYDITNFKHPGGSIVKFFANQGDATEAFNEFHIRSEKAKKILKSLPSRDLKEGEMRERVANGKSNLSRDFAKLRNDLIKEGYFNPNIWEITYRISEVIFLHILGAYFLIATNNFALPLRFVGLLMLAIAQGRCGWLMHEAGHYSLSSLPLLDRALQCVLYGVGCGMSAHWWRSQHNRHHATPQKLKHDVDLDTLPLVVFNENVVCKKRGVGKFVAKWIRWQAYLFMPVSCLLVALGWQFFLHPRNIYRQIFSARSGTKYFRLFGVLEMLSLVVRYVLIFGVVLPPSPPSHRLPLFLLYDLLAATYIFTNFALSHTHLPTTNENENLHWVEYAALHTTNIREGVVCNWWMAYLNFQIEHHLFPSMPQFNHPKISPRVREMFEKNGLKYDTRPYFSCLGQTLANLNTVGKKISREEFVRQKAKGA